jgi:hypothetical protein
MRRLALSGLLLILLGGCANMLASAEDGSRLRCEYQFDQMRNTGVGVCRDKDGSLYDFQIH